MLPSRPVLAMPRSLGQLSRFTGGITGEVAKQIVAEAEPALRRIIRAERNRFAEAVIGGIPLFALAAVGYSATRYLVPDGAKTGKFVGYAGSAAALAAGAWWTLAKLTERPEAPEAPPTGPAPEIVRQAAQAIVVDAEPRVRAIVDEERSRVASAALAGLPFAVASAAAFFATMFLVKPADATMKAIGYSGSAVLMGAGAWMALEKEREAA